MGAYIQCSFWLFLCSRDEVRTIFDYESITDDYGKITVKMIKKKIDFIEQLHSNTYYKIADENGLTKNAIILLESKKKKKKIYCCVQ